VLFFVVVFFDVVVFLVVFCGSAVCLLLVDAVFALLDDPFAASDGVAGV
jgi:hypothetical protein